MHQFLSDRQLTDLEERYKSLRKLLMIDVEALIAEVRAYKELASELQAGQKVHRAEVTVAIPEVKQTIQSVKTKPISSWDDLPSVLVPMDIKEILNIGRRGAYELLENPPFRVLRIGTKIKIPKDTFLAWLLENEKS